MKVLNMCDYCKFLLPECNANKVVFGIDLQVELDEKRSNDAVVACDTFEPKEQKEVLYEKL